MVRAGKKSLWLVTGGAGFIGSNIAETLARRGERVRILDNFLTGKRGHIAAFKDQVELVVGDIRNYGAVRKAMKGVSYVLHQAALRSVPKSVDHPTETNDINITGTLHVLLAAKEARVRRVVYASSSSVYGDAKKFPQNEIQRPQPVSPYAVSKLAGEQYAVMCSKTYGLETVSLRYFNVYGPRQDPESKYSAVIPKFMESALLGKTLEVHWDGRQSRDFTFVDDVVEANLRAAKAKNVSGEVFNVANGRTYSMLDIVSELEEILDRPLARKFFPRRAGDVRKTWADPSRARARMGYRCTHTFEEGILKTWQYFMRRRPSV